MGALPRLLRRARVLSQRMVARPKALWREWLPASAEPTPATASERPLPAEIHRPPPKDLTGSTSSRPTPKLRQDILGFVERAKVLWRGPRAGSASNITGEKLLEGTSITPRDHHASFKADVVPPPRIRRRRLAKADPVQRLILRKVNNIDKQLKEDRSNVLKWIAEAAISVLVCSTEELRDYLVGLRDYLKRLASGSNDEEELWGILSAMEP